MTLTLATWTHPTNGTVRIYVNGHDERHGKVWFENQDNFPMVKHSGEFHNMHRYSGMTPWEGIASIICDEMGLDTWEKMIAACGR